ncbi:MAG: transglycosylase domain-containing protein [Candidatus Dojkabacteria bacterium]
MLRTGSKTRINHKKFAKAKTHVHGKKYGYSTKSSAFRKGLPRTQHKQKHYRHKDSFKKGIKTFSTGIFVTLFFVASFSILMLIGVVSAYSKDLPDINEYFDQTKIEGKETIIVDRNGKELYRLQGEMLRERSTIDEVPEKLQWSFLAAEDAEFWEHQGLNLIGLSRAMLCVSQTDDFESCGGGSSITQQLVKTTTGKNQKTVDRKLQEAILAMKVEREYTKEDILEYYLNVVPEGGIIQGVKAGAKYLFGKELEELTLAEMAYLAAIPNKPTTLSPWGGSLYNPEQSQERATYVLDRMLETKHLSGITEKEITLAKEEIPKVKFLSKGIKKKAPHFTDYVITELDKLFEDKVDVEKGERGSDYLRDKGYRVITTVDLTTQDLMEKSIKEHIKNKDFQYLVGAKNASGVLMDPRTGEILAMAGSVDFYATSEDPRFSPQHNASLTPRSMGSTMKPALYLSAFRVGFQPSTIVPDRRLDLSAPGGRPYYVMNYSRSYSQYGANITMRTALKYSLNVPAAATYLMAGRENYIDTYYRLNSWKGFEDHVLGPAAPLGAANMPLLEQVHAFATMGSEGVYREKKAILEIQDDQGNVIYNNRKVTGKQTIGKKFMFLINDMNKKYWSFQQDNLLVDMSRTMDIAGKTGTGDTSFRKSGDVAFMVYSPTFALGMWAGNSCGAERCPLDGAKPSGDTLYRYILKEFLQKYRDKIEPARFTLPEGVVVRSRCLSYGKKEVESGGENEESTSTISCTRSYSEYEAVPPWEGDLSKRLYKTPW